MTTHDFLDPRELQQDLDRPLLADLPANALPPIFVLGLHRSGTTFLYQQLADHFAVATTRLYHITHFRRLLWARQEGLSEAYKADLAAALSARSVATRGIDGFPVGPDALEEYAFIMRKFGATWGFSERSAPLFDEVLRKLSALQPDAPALLLKNPPDLANAPAILARYPAARFIFIRRDPVRVLNSQFRNSFLYRQAPEPFLDVLLAGIPLWKASFRLMAGLDRYLPDALYQQILVRGLRRSIAHQLKAHYRSLEHLAPDSFIEVSYEDLLAAPGVTLDRIQRWIGLPYREDVAAMAAAPRLEPLLPAVEAVAKAFRRQLSAFPDARLGA